MKRLILEILSNRKLPGGGVADRPGGQFQVDATAWAILCSLASGELPESLEGDRTKLRSEQAIDGRVAVNKNHPDSYWPTSLAILAWQNSHTCRIAKDRAVQFLLETSGEHPKRKVNDPWSHDTASH